MDCETGYGNYNLIGKFIFVVGFIWIGSKGLFEDLVYIAWTSILGAIGLELDSGWKLRGC